MRAVLTALHTFAWIYVFESFVIVDHAVPLALARTMMLYALAQLIIVVATPWSARMLRHGMRREIVGGLASLALAFVLLGWTVTHLSTPSVAWGCVAFAVLVGVYRSLYWIPYELGNEERDSKLERQRAIEVCIALLPALVGALLSAHVVREFALMYIGAFGLLIAAIPILVLHDRYERFPWGYRETFIEMLSRKHWPIMVESVLDGIEGAALLLLWPIAIFLITDWSYLALGAILSITFLFVLLWRHRARSLARRYMPHASAGTISVVRAAAWIGRIFVISPVTIVLVDTYAHAHGYDASIDRPIGEQHADRGRYVDQVSVMRETGMALGRMLICIAAAGLVSLLSFSWACIVIFLIAAVVAALAPVVHRLALGRGA